MYPDGGSSFPSSVLTPLTSRSYSPYLLYLPVLGRSFGDLKTGLTTRNERRMVLPVPTGPSRPSRSGIVSFGSHLLPYTPRESVRPVTLQGRTVPFWDVPEEVPTSPTLISLQGPREKRVHRGETDRNDSRRHPDPPTPGPTGVLVSPTTDHLFASWALRLSFSEACGLGFTLPRNPCGVG